MSNPAFTDLADAAMSDSDRELISEVGKLIEQTQAAVSRARAQIDETARLMSALLNIGAMFESVATRLMDATFKTSDLATSGAVSHAILLSLVEELGDLARKALGGAGSVRSELRTYSGHTLPTVLAFRDAEALPVRGTIEIEHRSAETAPSKAGEKAAAGGVLTSRWARSGGYKN